jgi:hypothetical protein
VLLAFGLRSDLSISDAFATRVDPEEGKLYIEFIDEVDAGRDASASTGARLQRGLGGPEWTEGREIGRMLTATGLRVDEDELVGAGSGLDAIPESVLIREPSGGEMIPKQGILAVRS